MKLAFQMISDTYQRIADGRAEIIRILDEIEGYVGKIEKIMNSLSQHKCDTTLRSDD